MEKGTVSASAMADPAVKKLYRACCECVKIIDQAMKAKPNSSTLANLTATRKRLRDCCEKLLFMNPLEFGRKADEILWRKCHYEPIKVLRQQSEALSSESKCFLNTMLTSAIGYYQLLSLKLQHTFSIDPQPFNDFQITLESPVTRKPVDAAAGKSNADQKLRDWAMNELHRIFIYQGDLERYLHETDESVDIRTAQHYYHQALALKSYHGTPHNQLGTLLLAVNYGLDAAYHYLRSITSEENFSGSDDNLLALLTKNEQLFLQLSAAKDEDFDATSDIKNFAVTFLATVRILFLDEAEKNEDGTVQTLCSRTIHSFAKLLNSTFTSGSKSLDYNMLVKIFVIHMMLIGRLQEKGSLKLSPAVALFLSMFASFINAVVKDFCNNLASHRGDAVQTTGKPSLERCEAEQSLSTYELKTRSPRQKRPILTRRKKGHAEDEEEETRASDDESSRSSIVSENELNGDNGASGGTESDDVIEVSDDDELSIAKLIGENGKSKRAADQESPQQRKLEPVATPSGSKIQPWIDLSPAEKMETLLNYSPLVPLKIVFDWFRHNPNLLLMVRQNSSELWSTVARILNFLPDDRQLKEYVENDNQLSSELEEMPVIALNDWVQKNPLPEDATLRGTASLKQFHASLDYGCIICDSLEAEAVVRICCLRAFGHYLIRLNTPAFRFDRARLEFIATNGQVIIQDNMENDKKMALMRSMAQLRMKDELAAAEQVAWIPVYLVPGALTLCQKLPLIKKLASAQKFIMVIPTATINELDGMKKESGPARSATRWLENQFRRGNKFVRVQKSTERDNSIQVDDAGGDLPRNFLEILKCVAELRKLVKAGTAGGSTIVTILLSYAKNSAEYEQAEKILEAANLPAYFNQHSSRSAYN